MTGAEVKAYLEYSAKYFKTWAVGQTIDLDNINDSNVPDYNYDVISGLDYDIDIAKPVGQRITRLVLPGTDTPVPADAQFVVAVNNYRRSGGGNFPGIVKTQVYNQQQEIRQLLIDWAQAKGVIRPADFFVANWKLVREGAPVF
jgi:2',3'-cyclic-nucleotide 2'-phosphodiesterase / 3'-nucleotidase